MSNHEAEYAALPNAGCCPHWTGRHDPDDGSCDHCACVNRALIDSDEHRHEWVQQIGLGMTSRHVCSICRVVNPPGQESSQ